MKAKQQEYAVRLCDSVELVACTQLGDDDDEVAEEEETPVLLRRFHDRFDRIKWGVHGNRRMSDWNKHAIQNFKSTP